MTRAILGIGIGPLIHDKLRAEQRRAVGGTCLAVGLLTTAPLAARVYSSAHD